MAQNDKSMKVGAKIGAYKVIRLLGCGVIGEVYEVRHETLKTRCAIRVIPASFFQIEGALQRFERYAAMMANMNHPNIVRVDDFGTTDDFCWLRMELAAGYREHISLQDLADANGGVVEQMLLLHIMKDVLEAVAYGHARGVVHRNLKPSNILLFPGENGKVHAKVADYGLVEMMGEAFVRSRVRQSVLAHLGDSFSGSPGTAGEKHLPDTDGTHDNATRNDSKRAAPARALMQTWEYMSPEMREDATDIDTRSDVYSLGLIFYRLLTGEPPSLLLPSVIREELSPLWDAFCQKALAPKREYRYSDAGEMLEALARVWPSVKGIEWRREKIKKKTGEARPRRSKKISWMQGVLWLTLVFIILSAELFGRTFLMRHGGLRRFLSPRPTATAIPTSTPTPSPTPTSSPTATAIPTPTPPHLDASDFVFIPPGTFRMGSPEDEPERWDDETRHRVTLTHGFYMCDHEVTQAEWVSVMGKNPSHFKGVNRPVESVTWYDCCVFCNRLSDREGYRPAYYTDADYRYMFSGSPPTVEKDITVYWDRSANGYRLPTEAEWEYACRAGTRGPFSFGVCLGTDKANFQGESPMPGCPKGINRNVTWNVKSGAKNAWGLYDMHGNVWERCWDWYGEYGGAPARDPLGASTGVFKVFRGGSLFNPEGYCRSASRGRNAPYRYSRNIGFRLARNK